MTLGSSCSCKTEKELTGIIKFANFDLANPEFYSSEKKMVKEASSIETDGDSVIDRVLKEQMADHPTALFFRAKAIEAGIPNNNGDCFSEEQLKKSCQTFVGVPFFTNHQNGDVEKAKGKIVHAEWDEKDKAIYVIAFVDREAYPHLCRGIEEGYVNSVSMGCSVSYSVCSICGNRAESQEQYCNHIKNIKGRKFTGKVVDVKTGQTKDLKDAPVYEDNYDIRFIELSGVVDPACASCKIKEVYKNDELMKAAAFCYNDLSMFKSSEMMKEASQQDVDQLNQALDILQNVAIKLIQNRANVEMEFSADIVKILADLQEYVDGLVQAGFGKVQDIPGNALGQGAEQGAEQAAQPEMAPPGMEQGGTGATGQTMPVSAESSLGGGNVGEVSGTPGASLVQSPMDLAQTMRPPPGKQMSIKLQRPTKPSRAASQENGDHDMRRIAPTISQQKEKVSAVLEKNWQEKLNNFSNTLRESIKDELNSKQMNKSGGTIMSTKITQEAKSKETPNLVVEKRLDSDIRLHPRTDSVKEDVIGKQLTEKHKGNPEVTEEVLLESARLGSGDSVVEETFLEKGREGDTAPDTEQKKLEKQRVNKEPETTMENLLGESKNDSPSTRSAASLSDHVEAAIDIISKSVVFAQSTPDRVIKIAGSISGLSLSDQSAIIKKIASAVEDPSYEDIQKRTSFWADKGLQVTSASDKDIKDMLISFASKSVKEKELNPELVLKAFSVLRNNKNSSSIVEEKVKELVTAGVTGIQADVEDEMSSYLNKKAKAEKCPKCGEWPFTGKCKCKKEEKGEDGEKDEKDEKKDDKEEKTEKCSSIKAETSVLEKVLAKEAKEISNLVIETNFDEMGIQGKARDDDRAIAICAEAFARGACANLGVKLAAVVNVTVDGESGDVVIAVDTGEGSVEIPVGGGDKDMEMDENAEIGSEEALDDSAMPPAPAAEGATDFGTSTAAPAAGAVGAVGGAPAPAAGGISSLTSSKKPVKTAQFGGGSPGAGGTPPAEGGKSSDPTAGLTTPPTDPGVGAEEGLQSFTDETDELPGDEEQKEPGSICFICGSSDTETGRKDQAPGQFDCNSCGVKYTIHVNVEVLNPQEAFGDKDEDLDAEIESPEAPSMPIAAEVSIDRDSMKKIAKYQKEVGDVCPACGSVDVEASGEKSDSKITCKKCKTASEKVVLINVENPIESVMRVSWSLDPMKRKCGSCRETAKKFAADRVFNKMLKVASAKQLPEAKIRGWLKVNYPNTEFVTNGPYKGQNFADTVVGQLKRFGLTKNKYLIGLASAQSKEDPMDKCIRDNKKKGFTLAESNKLCNCMKAKYASEEDDNIYIQAFEKKAHISVLRKMAEYDANNIFKNADNNKVQIDENATFDSLPEVVVEDQIPQKETIDLHEEISLEEEAVQISATSNGQKKTAAELGNPPPKVTKTKDETKTKTQDNSEKKVDSAGVVCKENHMSDDKADKANASRGSIGEELTEVIPGPDVPRGDATMGKETKAPEQGVKVPSKEKGVDTSSLGQSEASTEENKMNKQAYAEQEKMTRKSPEVKNPDNTSGDTALQEKNNTEKKVEKVEDTVGNVTVPRSKATINSEEPAATKGPDVPRSNATMGHENPPEAKEPVVPSEVGDTQVKMTGRNTTEADRQVQLERVSTVRREHAMRYAGQLIEKGLIKEEELDSFVSDLSSMPLDRMKAHVALILKPVAVQKTASVAQQTTLSTPIIKEATSVGLVPEDKDEPSMAEKLSKMFTIGNKQQDRAIRVDLAEKEKEDRSLFTI